METIASASPEPARAVFPQGELAPGCTFRLQHDRHVRIPGGQPTRILCVSGLVWVTAEGELHDWVLRSGEEAAFPHGALLVGALVDSEIRVPPVPATAPGPVLAVWALAALFARRLLRLPPSLGCLEPRHH